MIKKSSFTLIFILILIFGFSFSIKSKEDNLNTLKFSNVTKDVISGATCEANKPFDIDFMDANNDGLFDIFAYSHHGVEHCLYMQVNDGTHTYKYIEGRTANYSQEKIPPRGAFYVNFSDLNGDKKEDFTSLDTDINGAAWINAKKDNSDSVIYKNKVNWCGPRDHCTIGEINGDGLINVIHKNGVISTFTNKKRIHNLKKKGYWQAIDLNNDSWPDLIDVVRLGYWKNDKTSFSWHEAEELKVCKGGYNKSDFADFDNDGYIDLICANRDAKEDNKGGNWFVFKNHNGEYFENMTEGSGLESIGWNPYWSNYSNTYNADLDNDGNIDIVFPSASHESGKGLLIMRNTGNFKFKSVKEKFNNHCDKRWDCKPRIDVADYDNDGLLDLLKMYSGSNRSSFELYRNSTNNKNNWLKIRARGKKHNTDGLHAKITLLKSDQEAIISSYIISSHFNGSMKYIHAGLNTNSKVDVKITWPHDDGEEIFKSISSNQEIIIHFSPSGSKVVKNWKPGSGW